jgi:hypothetical protein
VFEWRVNSVLETQKGQFETCYVVEHSGTKIIIIFSEENR